MAPIPAQPQDWALPRWGERPPVLGAIGVTSIIIACIGGLFGLVLVIYGFVFYVATIAMSTHPAWGASAGAPAVVVAGGGAASSGLTPAQRQAAIVSLTGKHALDDPRRLEQLDAILATAGSRLGADAVLESGTMPDSRDGERGADYFVTTRGRLELFNDRAVFFPVDGSDTVRVSAPKQGAKPGAPAPETSPDADADESEDGSTPSATAPGTGGPGTAGPAGAAGGLGALTPAEGQGVVRQAQSLAGTGSGGGLNPQQAATLQALVSTPGQQLIPPGTAQAAVISCFVQPDGTATVGFGNGSMVVLGPQGNVVSQVNFATFAASFSPDPWSVALFIVTAVLSVALSVLLLVAGILTLGRSRAARRLHLIYASLKIPAALAGGVAIAFLVYELSKGSTPGGAAAGGATRGAAGFLTAIVPTLLACIYPVVLLAVLNAKSVRDHYRSIAA
jgi:hypothetical protein